MGKRVTVMLFGKMVRKGVQIDADATEGAIVGTNLRWPDGSKVTEAQIRNTTSPSTTTTAPGASSTGTVLWGLILSVPAIIKSLAALTTKGWIRNDSGVISASQWPYTKKSVETGETMTIPTGHELIVFKDFTMDGTIILDGDLVVLE